MWKQLIWKEWRQNKAILYVATLSFFALVFTRAGMYWLPIYLTEDTAAVSQNILLQLKRDIRVLSYYFLSSCFAILVAAISFAEERSKKTIEFLLTQPITRTSIWVTKTVCGLALVALIFLLYNIFHTLSFAWMDVVRPSTELPPYLPYSIYLIFLCYAITLLFSTLLDNTPITILAGGITTLLLIFLGVSFLNLDWKVTFQCLFPMSLGFILLSYFIFCGAEIISQFHTKTQN